MISFVCPVSGLRAGVRDVESRRSLARGNRSRDVQEEKKDTEFKTMKIAFVSDLHGSLSATRAALEAADAWGAERIAVLGDVMYHGPRNPFPQQYAPAEVAECLNRYADRIVAVRGNCDSEVDQMLVRYPMMGDYAVIALPQRDIFLTHGHLYSPESHPALREGSILAFGHIHTPVAERGQGVFYFNPGSAALPKDPYPATWGRFDGRVLEVVDFAGEIIKSLAL